MLIFKKKLRNAPSFDPLLRKVDYYRSKEQSEALALNPDDDVHNEDDEIAQKSKLDSTELVPDHKDPTEITRIFPLHFPLHHHFTFSFSLLTLF